MTFSLRNIRWLVALSPEEWHVGKNQKEWLQECWGLWQKSYSCRGVSIKKKENFKKVH